MANTKLPNLNKVLIVGNLVKDPELRYTTTGVPVVNFKIASSKKFKDGLGTLPKRTCAILEWWPGKNWRKALAYIYKKAQRFWWKES